jgi:4-hydroxy-3-polyprenylbenzoate decarboxylase
MGYASLRACVDDLDRNGQLVRIADEIDPHLEMAAIHRRVYAAGGPAVLYERVKGSPFPAVSNLFGTLERARFMFRDTLARTKDAIELKAHPEAALRRPWRYLWAPLVGLRALPKRVGSGPILHGRTTISQLPQMQSWPDDGGPFITLPAVYSEHPEHPGPMKSNLGMYRVQLAGNDYERDTEVGLHYQIHRGIGVHHSAAVRTGEPLRVSVFVGGPPAHVLAAVMPLPEGLSELVFAGMLAGRRFRHLRHEGHVLSADADFCIVGTIDPTRTKPEGPFGDHLGYYSLVHEYPVLRVEAVYHREDAIWPFTVVGRPPQEDTIFGQLIHEMTAPMVPVTIPGLHAMHAVDAAGVHPLMLAIGSERYVPWGERVPQELLTIANAILGFNQASLAKYLLIVAREDDDDLDVHDIEAFVQHVLRRVDFMRDLHFQTRTTIDTLDYSGTGLNEGSKLVIAAAGEPRRVLATSLPDLALPEGFGPMRLALPGVAAVEGPAFARMPGAAEALGKALAGAGRLADASTELPLLVLVDDADFTAKTLRNLLWVAFTRSNPSHDVHGVDAFVDHKHWGCRGSLIIDARIKPHHAPPLVEDPDVERRVDALAAPGRPLHGIV